MYKMKNILLEEKNRTLKITESTAVSLIKKNKIPLKYIIDNRMWLYRSDDILGKYLFSDPYRTNKLRKSKNISNYYTLIIDNSENWSAFPKRSRSLILSNTIPGATGYGKNMYIVIPLEEKCKIGICPKSDIWYSFGIINRFYGDLESWTSSLNELYFNLMNKELSDTTIDSFKNGLNKLEKKIRKIIDSIEWTNDDPISYINLEEKIKSFLIKKNIDEVDVDILLLWFKEYYGSSLFDFLTNVLLDPFENGFKIINYYNEPEIKRESNSKEVWTDSKCLLIAMNDFHDFLLNNFKFKEKIKL